MRRAIHSPTLAQDIGSLAALYRTVFRMMGRKIQYGQVWPDEVYRAKPDNTRAPAESEVREKELVGSR